MQTQNHLPLVTNEGQSRVIGVEGFGDYYEGVSDVFQIGTKTRGVGVNLGVGGGWFGTQTYTILFNLPPPDFWLRPRPRW